jgi:hypothetical protein
LEWLCSHFMSAELSPIFDKIFFVIFRRVISHYGYKYIFLDISVLQLLFSRHIYILQSYYILFTKSCNSSKFYKKQQGFKQVCFLLESLKEGEKHKSFIETALAKIALNYVILHIFRNKRCFICLIKWYCVYLY